MQTHSTNTLAATGQILEKKGIHFNEDALKNDLLSHPDYPSLFAVHHVLAQYGVANSPVEADEEHLDKLGQPFLAYMQLPGLGSDFATVTNVHNGSVTFTNVKGKAQTIKRADFLSKWKNIAVMIEDGEPIGNQLQANVAVKNKSTITTSKDRVRYLKLAGVFCIILLFAIVTLNASNPLIFLPWLLLKLGGLTITILLLMYEADRQNETVKQFCSAGKTINCDAVLQSKGAKVGGFSWSELGFAYFAGTFCFLLFFSNSMVGYLPLAILSLVVLPYTVYSIYYQYGVVKQWCRLCLFVQGIIVAEAIFVVALYLSMAALPSFAWPDAFLLLPFIVLPLLIWLLLKPSFQKAATADGYKYAYLRQQNNPEVFNAMLQRQAAAPSGFEDCGLLIGNPNASQTIIKICNPFCGPCASAHPILENIVEKYDVKMYILFLGTNVEIEGRNFVIRHFIAIFIYQGAHKAQEAMHWWYLNNYKELKLLLERYPVEIIDSEEINEWSKKMQAWTDKADIMYTPTVYIEGHKLPNTYRLGNLEKLFGYE